MVELVRLDQYFKDFIVNLTISLSSLVATGWSTTGQHLKYWVSTHSPHTMDIIITCAFSNVLIMDLSLLELHGLFIIVNYIIK